MCKYCCGSPEPLYEDLQASGEARESAFVRGDLLCVSHYGIETATRIVFCPICGRDLLRDEPPAYEFGGIHVD